MQFNNVIASSNLASQRTNEFSFTMSYDDYIVVPKSVSVSKASIPNTMLSFRKNQLNIFIQFLGATYSFPIQNGYYDNITLKYRSTLNTVSFKALTTHHM